MPTVAQEWSWAHAMAHTAGGRGTAAAVAEAPEGGVYVAGTFIGSMTIGGATLTAEGGSQDAFVARFDRSGAPVWARHVAGPDRSAAVALAADAGGAAYLVGDFFRDATVGGVELSSAGGNDVFVVKFSPDGAVVWARPLGGAGPDNAGGVGVDASGEVVVAGRFAGTTEIGGEALVSAGSTDIWLARLNAVGTVLWATRMGGDRGDRPSAVAAATDGGVVVVGEFSGTADFGGQTLVGEGLRNAFVVRLRPDGTAAWAASAGGATAETYAFGTALTPEGDVIAVGRFEGTATFGAETMVSEAGSPDGFVARFDADGRVAWATPLGGAHEDALRAAAVGPDGEVTVAGRVEETLTFGASVVTAAGGSDAVVARVGPEGTPRWAVRGGGEGMDEAVGVAALGDGAAVVGVYRAVSDFGAFLLTSSPATDPAVFAVGVDLGATAAAPGPSPAVGLSVPSPNPASSVVTVQLRSAAPGPVRVEVLDVVGRRLAVVHDGPASGVTALRVGTGALPAGVYVMRATGRGGTASRRFVVGR